MAAVFDTVTLKIWHGGVFKNVKNGDLVYEGGKGQTFDMDPDEICLPWLMDLTKKCGNYNAVECFYYLIPRQKLVNGLRKVVNDELVREMIEVVKKCRCLEVYVLHGLNDPAVVPTEVPCQKKSVSTTLNTHPSSSRPKLPIKKGPPVRSSPRKVCPTKLINEVNTQHIAKKDSSQKAPASLIKHKKDAPTSVAAPNPSLSHHSSQVIYSSPKTSSPQATSSSLPQPSNTSNDTLQSYDWIDPRPNSPIPLNDLLLDPSDDSDSSDPSYIPEFTKQVEGNDFTGDLLTDEDSGDEYEDEGDAFELEDLDEQEDQFEKENEEILNDDLQYQSDSGDEEYIVARQRVKDTTAKLIDIAREIQKQAARGQKVAEEGETGEVGQPSCSEGGPQSDYEDSEDDIHTPPASGDETADVTRRRRSSLLVCKSTDFAKFNWKVGQKFATRGDFKNAVAKYGVLQGRDVHFTVSNKKRQQRLGVKCIEKCPFYVYASWDSRRASVVVKTVKGEHTCQRNMKRNRQLKTTWVAQQFLEVFKSRPHWPAKEIQECVRKAFRMLVSKVFAYIVKYAAHKMLHGSLHDHYNKLGGYMAALKASSPGTCLELVIDSEKGQFPPIFQRLFISFEGLKEGWKQGCRRVLAVDACFIKTFLGGQLLSAIGRDSNDQMFPVCWAVVEGENNSSWEWFFRNLQVCLDLGEGDGMSIISDEHQGILYGVSTVLPSAEHRHCARHIFAHWHKKHRGDELKLQFWKVAKAYNMAGYTEALDELKLISVEAASDFESHNPKLFCRAFLNPSIKTDAITSNIAETFNGYIIQARTKHLLYMLEDIRSALMQRLFVKRQQMMKAATKLCPRIQSKLEVEKTKAAECEVLPSSEHLFNVSYYLDQLVVNLETRSCTCRKWDMLGIPCFHAVASIYYIGEEPEQYVDECYYRDTYLSAYAGSIQPCEGERHWPKVDCPIAPPPIKIGPGRPRKNRIKDPFENPKKKGTMTKNGVEMTCSLCHTKGHNKRKCPNKDTIHPTEPAPKKPRGRPRKDAQHLSQPTNASTTADVLPPTPQPNTSHHSITAQPSQLGRGGRMITGGRGSRGGRGKGQASATGRGGGNASTRGRGTTGGRGRGHNQQIPVGVGVFISPDESALTNQTSHDAHGGAAERFQLTQSSQTSTSRRPRK